MKGNNDYSSLTCCCRGKYWDCWVFGTNKVEGVKGRPMAPALEDPVPGPAASDGGVTFGAWEP
jgi:hypothetical protein